MHTNLRPQPLKLTAGRRFTLIEMLVVIAIIAIIAGLLSGPVMESVVAGRRTACMNSLKQAAVALNLYVQNNDQYPCASNKAKNTSATFTYVGISEALKGYADENVFRCPADDRGYFEANKSSYEWFSMLNGQSKTPKFGPPGHAHTADLTRTPCFWDYDAFHGRFTIWGGSDYSDDGDDTNDSYIKRSDPNARNIVYLDCTVNPL